MRQYSGPGGWADPDLLIGPNGVADGTYATDLQARTQVNLWSVISAPLLISNNLLKASQYNIDSYGNTEVIAVNQVSFEYKFIITRITALFDAIVVIERYLFCGGKEAGGMHLLFF